MNPNYEMLFEITIRTFLGDKAYHIAGQAHSEKLRKKWYKKALKKIVVQVQDIDSSIMHKEQLTYWSERALEALNQRKLNEKEFSLCLLRLSGALLGFVGVRGANIVTLSYHQDRDQYYTEKILQGGDVMQDYYDQQSSTGIRNRIINQLKDEGLSDFKISLILNTSEYQVKKSRKNSNKAFKNKDLPK